MRTPSRASNYCLPRTRLTRALFALALPALALLAFALPWAQAAGASEPGPQVIVEFSPAIQDVLNAPVTRRLIQLELAEAKLTPNPSRSYQQPLTLFYRLLLTHAGELRIELWERGEFYGARRVSAAHGNKKLLARHVALATAELAQRLSRAHSQRAKEVEEVERRARQHELARAEAARLERWALVSVADAAWLPDAEAALLGPRLGFQLNQPKHGRLEFTVGWLFSTGGALPGVDGLEWLELKFAPSYRIDRAALAIGFDVAAAMLLLSGPAWVDGIAGQRQTWSSRGGAHLHFQPQLSPSLKFHVGAEAAWLLREVPTAAPGEAATQLQGVWLGLSLGFLTSS
jgi:hypothetical protein